MRYILFLLMFLAGSLAHAGSWDQRFFISYTDQDECCADYPVEDHDDAAAGLLVGYTTDGPQFIGADVYFHNYEPGADLRAGLRGDWGELSAGYGLYNYTVTKQRDVAGNVVQDYEADWAGAWFAEYSRGAWFARYTYVDAENTMNYSTNVGGTVFTDSETVETNDQWLWVGYRFSY